jgi:ornithine--oxo-acid transaminase
VVLLYAFRPLIFIQDVDGKEYIDFLAMFSATNFGHCHPYILEKVMEQMQSINLINGATHNAFWPPFAKMMCDRFGYDKICGTPSGTEAADIACKIARKWGIKVKGITPGECLILGVGQSYHGLGSAVWPLMDPTPARAEYGISNRTMMNVNPSTGATLGYLDLAAMRRCLEEHHSRTAAVIMEPFHGSSRTVEEERAYARGVYDLCQNHNVLFIADEVRQGVGKTGKFFSFYHLGDDCKPDIVTLGKSITAGMYPQSFIMGTDKVMSLVGVGQVVGTFAKTPMAVAAARAAIELLDKRNLMERASELGKKWKAIVTGWNHPKVDYVSSMGADSNLVLKDTSGYRFAALCMHKGLISYARPDGLRIGFALTMTDAELERGAVIIREALDEVDEYGDIPGEGFPL